MSYGNLYRPDLLFLPQQALLRFAGQVPTPFFLYDEDGIRKAACTVKGSFSWNRGHRQWFPLMANAAPAVLDILREEGFGILVHSEQELLYARRCGFTGAEILLHTPAMTDGLAALAKQLGCGVIFDAPGQIEKMADQLPPCCLLRFCPERISFGSGFTECGDKGRSGMDHAELLQAASRLRALGAEEIGLSANARNEDRYPAVADALFALAVELRNRLGIEVCCCDLGGGISPVQNLPHIGAVLRDRYQSIFSEGNAPAIYTELGAYALQNHGILVCRVVEIRERSRMTMILDASVPTLPGWLERRGTPHISVVGNCRRSGRQVWSVYGCGVDPCDRFGERVVLPAVQPGGLIAIHDVGAYWPTAQSRVGMSALWDGYLFTRQGEIISADLLKASEQTP